MTRVNDGDINEVLVTEFWPGAKWNGKEWRCADISGREPKNKGSF